MSSPSEGYDSRAGKSDSSTSESKTIRIKYFSYLQYDNLSSLFDSRTSHFREEVSDIEG